MSAVRFCRANFRFLVCSVALVLFAVVGVKLSVPINVQMFALVTASWAQQKPDSLRGSKLNLGTCHRYQNLPPKVISTIRIRTDA